MQVTLLGTGSALPSPGRLQAGLLVEETDRRLLIDCGSGVSYRLRQAGIAPADIDTVLLTHHHLDHVIDLPTLFKARILTDSPTFTVIGPPGTSEVCDHLFSVDTLAEQGDARILEYAVEDFPRVIAGFKIEVAETTHSKQCYAYRFGDDLFVSGDTAPDLSVFAAADGVHTLIHECSYPDTVETEGHTTPAGLIEGMQDIAVDRLVITHVFPQAERQIDSIESQLSDEIDAEIVIGTDGLRMVI